MASPEAIGFPASAYPAVVTVWDEMRLALLDLEGSGALTQYPDPRETEDRQPPIDITLAPWATDAAEDLHRRFGDDVSLVVGVMPYPSRSLPDWLSRDPEEVEVTDSNEFRFELDGGVEAPSGYSSRIGLRVHNLTPVDITVQTNGLLTASIIDPVTGKAIGQDTRSQKLPLVRFMVPAGGSTVIPLLIGTTSFRPELGYAVPPGEWAVSADLRLEDGRVLRTPPMAITVTA